MTTDDILRMAEEADALADKEISMPGEYHPDWHDVRDRHFAALVAAAEREARQAAQHQVAELQERLNRSDAERCSAVLAEREECAKVCDEAAGMLLSHRDRAGSEIAVALRDSIRARGKT